MLMKTMKPHEALFYIENIETFYNYYNENPESLIS
jgi:hypothetical protein